MFIYGLDLLHTVLEIPRRPWASLCAQGADEDAMKDAQGCELLTM